jgi:hypothetical protein
MGLRRALRACSYTYVVYSLQLVETMDTRATLRAVKIPSGLPSTRARLQPVSLWLGPLTGICNRTGVRVSPARGPRPDVSVMNELAGDLQRRLDT